MEEGLDVRSLECIKLVHHCGNTSVRRRLEKLPIELYSSCIIFADQQFEDDSMLADSHSLATLVLIRDIQNARDVRTKCPVSCEVLDSRTQETVSNQPALNELSNFVQSNRLVAKILAMIGETRTVKVILDELLGAEGNNLLVLDSAAYVASDEVISFYTLGLRVAQRNGILIGYQCAATAATTLNPCDKHEPMGWTSLHLAIIAGEHNDERVKMTNTDNRTLSKVRPAVLAQLGIAGPEGALEVWKKGRMAAWSCGRGKSSTGNVTVQDSTPIGGDSGGGLPEAPDVGHCSKTGMAAVDEAISRQCTMMNPAEKILFGQQLEGVGRSITEGKSPWPSNINDAGISRPQPGFAETRVLINRQS